MLGVFGGGNACIILSLLYPWCDSDSMRDPHLCSAGSPYNVRPSPMLYLVAVKHIGYLTCTKIGTLDMYINLKVTVYTQMKLTTFSRWRCDKNKNIGFTESTMSLIGLRKGTGC